MPVLLSELRTGIGNQNGRFGYRQLFACHFNDRALLFCRDNEFPVLKNHEFMTNTSNRSGKTTQ